MSAVTQVNTDERAHLWSFCSLCSVTIRLWFTVFFFVLVWCVSARYRNKQSQWKALGRSMKYTRGSDTVLHRGIVQKNSFNLSLQWFISVDFYKYLPNLLNVIICSASDRHSFASDIINRFSLTPGRHLDHLSRHDLFPLDQSIGTDVFINVRCSPPDHVYTHSAHRLGWWIVCTTAQGWVWTTDCITFLCPILKYPPRAFLS